MKHHSAKDKEGLHAMLQSLRRATVHIGLFFGLIGCSSIPGHRRFSSVEDQQESTVFYLYSSIIPIDDARIIQSNDELLELELEVAAGHRPEALAAHHFVASDNGVYLSDREIPDSIDEFLQILRLERDSLLQPSVGGRRTVRIRWQPKSFRPGRARVGDKKTLRLIIAGYGSVTSDVTYLGGGRFRFVNAEIRIP
jgi:hypothetical protein